MEREREILKKFSLFDSEISFLAKINSINISCYYIYNQKEKKNIIILRAKLNQIELEPRIYFKYSKTNTNNFSSFRFYFYKD